MKKLLISLILFFLVENINSSNILFFNQDCNVDLAGADNTCADERQNLLNILLAEGHNVTTLDDFHNPKLDSLLSANELLVIPDLEDSFVSCNINDLSFFSLTEQTSLVNYINNGGNLLITGSTQNINLLNKLFDLGLSNAGAVNASSATLNIAQAAGTPFENCPPTIPNLSATFLLTSTLPSNKKCIYESGGAASLAYFSQGDGTITYIGYDYNDVGPGCSVDGESWISCALDASINVALINNIVPVPTLSLPALICCLMAFLLIGFKLIKL